MSNPPKLEESWLRVLGDEFDKSYMKRLRLFLAQEVKQHKVYPHGRDIFNAFHYTPFDQVRVVILGQDPYHGPGQAHGLSFSVRKGMRVPPSLENIFKELHSDLNVQPPNHGELTHWAQQGVLLLNASLTVRHRKANSHKDQGWEVFTDRVIEVINQEKEHVVFVLWGAKAGAKAPMIDTSKHLIIRSPHPSPYSADRGFFGSKPFSKINTYLQQHDLPPIDWSIPN